MNPFFLTDAYKISHQDQYPQNTEFVYSNTTPRKSRIPGVAGVVVFGTRYFIREYLQSTFNEFFFDKDWGYLEAEMREFFDRYFGPGTVKLDRFKALHELGYLPIRIKALPEGEVCPIGVPFMTVENTEPEFYWVTNFIETLTQTVIWNMVTSATTAKRFRELLDHYAEKTGDPAFVDFQGHNFSMRGMSSVESAITTDMGHLLSFKGSDTLAGNDAIDSLYVCDGLISCSIPATEHAVMCAGGMQDERETFRRLICDIYPSGLVSIVSDTWNLWDVLTKIAPSLKEEIEARDGKVVFRPDSGDPVKIICGYVIKDIPFTSVEMPDHRLKSLSFHTRYLTPTASGELYPDAVRFTDGVTKDLDGKVLSECEVKGCVTLLDEQFGSSLNSKGYRDLNPKVGLIYGDSITLERCEAICKQLEAKGYASTNLVYGVGSYTYQYTTRDTFSIACKATWVQVDGVGREIFKDPVTDDGTKKSACGLLCVYRDENGDIKLLDRATRAEERNSLLETIFEDGVSYRIIETLEEIRSRLRSRTVSKNLPAALAVYP